MSGIEDSQDDQHAGLQGWMIMVDAYDRIRSTSDCRIEFSHLGSRTAGMISTQGLCFT
jgi:hypothetical protein